MQSTLFCLPLHEPVAIDSRPDPSPGAATNRLADQAAIGSRKTLSRDGYPDYVFSFHEGEEIGPRMLARIAKRTDLTPIDL